MNIEGMVGTESKSEWTVTPTKINKTKCTSSNHRKEVYKFPMNPMKDVGGVEETKFLTYKVYVRMGNNSVKIFQSKILNHMHIFISGRKSTNFKCVQ